MDALDKYLADSYPADDREVAELQKMLESVFEMYPRTFSKLTGWFYTFEPQSDKVREVNEGNVAVEPRDFSQSTTAMILCALLRLGGYFKAPRSGEFKKINRATSFEFSFAAKGVQQRLLESIRSAASLLRMKLTVADGNSFKNSTSSTFGENDVFTLIWLAEISQASWKDIDPDSVDFWAAAAISIKEIAKEKISKSEVFSDFSVLFNPKDGTPLKHSFAALRLIQIKRRLDDGGGEPLPELYSFFEAILHEHLSFSSIPDSRFDPAELAFSLEGMMLCQKNTVDQTVFDRVLSVLANVQHESAFWRPAKPILATRQGAVIFPVSVEIANSLMRSCEIFDGDALHDTYGSQAMPLVGRYWQWLRARAVRFVSGGHENVGWHSEHVNEPSLIHLWETSQAMEFMMSYRNALCMHIARTTLVASRFKVERPKLSGEWSDVIAQFEATTAFGEKQKIYSEIDKEFIVPSGLGKQKNYSMLLYGPAGTGKTSVAESVAAVLDRRLITITVSDFLAEGGAQIEARAKNVFTALNSQPPSVILFDEIDHFLLDRDSERYSKQETVFQFMTPGMLTKINDLRRRKSSIFVVATNYEDRIDSAIKRTGRIDRKYLVLPPDMDSRKRIILDLAKSRSDSPEIKKQLEDLAKSSVFLGFKDLEAAVEAFPESEQVTALISDLKSRARTTSLEAYRGRFLGEGGHPCDARQAPMAEFLGLIALFLEVGDSPTAAQNAAIRAFVAVLSPEKHSLTLGKNGHGAEEGTRSTASVPTDAPNIDNYATSFDSATKLKISAFIQKFCDAI